MSIGVGLGITNFPFDEPRDFFRWAQLCEEHKVDSLWQSDRLISKETHLESMSTMAALAGITERIRFGMNVVVAPLRDPLVLAKQCATIDFLSNGRLLPAFGVGFTRALEWNATARDAKERGAPGQRNARVVHAVYGMKKTSLTKANTITIATLLFLLDRYSDVSHFGSVVTARLLFVVPLVSAPAGSVASYLRKKPGKSFNLSNMSSLLQVEPSTTTIMALLSRFGSAVGTIQ